MAMKKSLRWIAMSAIAFAPVAASQISEARRVELVNMVRQECGSCHGLTLKGGLGPALLPAALADKDSSQLRHVILYGRPGTAMPPWKDFLGEPEAQWIIEMLRNGFPDAR